MAGTLVEASLADDPGGLSVADIAEQLAEQSQRRFDFIKQHQDNHWSQLVEYQDSEQMTHQHPLLDLLLHVSHHGVHHRAQALSYLKSFGCTVPGGIDYLFYRMATGSTRQSPEAIEQMTQFGLGVNETMGVDVQWDPAIIRRQFEYTDWAMDRIFQQAIKLDEETLDRPFDLGIGSIRKNLLHIFDAEQWWVANWTVGPQPFPHTPASTSIAQLQRKWSTNAKARNRYLEGVGEDEAQREIEVTIGGPPTRFKAGEAAIQLTLHGTHHRAQIVNLFRQVGATFADIDLIDALPDLSLPANA